MACSGAGIRHRPQVFVLSRWADSRVRGGGDREMAGLSPSQSVFPRQFWKEGHGLQSIRVGKGGT